MFSVQSIVEDTHDWWQEQLGCEVLTFEQEQSSWTDYFSSVIPCSIEDFIYNPQVEIETLPQTEIDQMKYDPSKGPVTLCMPLAINDTTKDIKLLRVLFDSGASNSSIHRRALPVQCKTTSVEPVNINGFGGMSTLNEKVTLKQCILPEFSRSYRIDEINAFVHDNDTSYDLIIGRDVLMQCGFSLDFENQVVKWMEMEVSMKSSRFWNSRQNVELAFVDWEGEQDGTDDKDCFITNILPSKYDNVTPEQVAEHQDHLTGQQREELTELLHEFPALFNGQLKHYPQSKVHLQLKPDAKPFQCRPYQVPFAHRELFKGELDRLVQQGVLEPANRSQWTAPTFITPKKDGRVRWVSDFRVLNKNLFRRQYELPRIKDILDRRSGYKYFTKLDISMQYYTFELDESSAELCTITTPYGLYRYKRLPMGILESPDIAQEIMENILRDCDCEVYIDDIGCFSNDWNEHLKLLSKVLHKMQDNGFTMNPLKCEWAVKETDWLGYWLTPAGLKPWSKKIKPILAMETPKNVREVRHFLGAVTFYKDMWKRRSHILAPLTKLTGGKFAWGEEQQQAFDEIKALMAKDVMLFYPDHNKPFHIYTDSSDYQLGSTISQRGDDGILHPVAYFSRKLNSAQMNYPVGEKEFLSIFETLRTYRTMLLGAELHIHTDHRNLTFKSATSQRMLRWRVFIEEFGPILHFIPGEQNTCADYFSRIGMSDSILEEKSGPKECLCPEDSYYQDLINDDLDLATCLYFHPLIEECMINVEVDSNFPFNFQVLQQEQLQDHDLAARRRSNPTEYVNRQIAPEINLVYHRNRIFVPAERANRMIRWYHNALNHAGQTRLINTFNEHFFTPKLQDIITSICSRCELCQINKIATRKYGHLPPRTVTLEPWAHVAVDLIGPWDITIQGQKYTFHALTMIDTDTNLPEAVRIRNKTSRHISMLFENTWLSRYPRPVDCIYDRGSEFIGFEFQNTLQRYNINPKQITTKNPQANAICERMHQTMANQLRAITRQNPPQDLEQAQMLVDTMLSNTVYALRASINTSLNAAPGSIVFGRDMILNLPFVTDIANIRNRRQALVDKSNARENAHRYDFNYQVGQWVTIRADLHQTVARLQPRFIGPFQIVQVHVNGTVTIRKRPHVLERINIRRIQPYRQF